MHPGHAYLVHGMQPILHMILETWILPIPGLKTPYPGAEGLLKMSSHRAAAMSASSSVAPVDMGTWGLVPMKFWSHLSPNFNQRGKIMPTLYWILMSHQVLKATGAPGNYLDFHKNNMYIVLKFFLQARGLRWILSLVFLVQNFLKL